MPLKKFATLAEIAEADRPNAIELKDGSFALVEDEDTTELKSATEKERLARQAAERLADKAAKELQKLQTERKAQDAGLSAEQLQKIRDDVRADVMKEVQSDIDAGKAALSENRALKLDGKVRAIALKHGVRADRIDAWWQLFGGRFDLTDDGKEPIVKDKAGVKLENYITEHLKKELPDFYEGSKASGGDALGNMGGGGSGGVTTADILANPAAALQAARAAGKTE